ncbi:MAG: nucleoside transporter C-terminal domain-containing protein [Acetobacteraceae bacterium]
MGLLGFAALLALAFLCSEDRRRIPWRTVIVGLALQLVLAVLLIHLSAARSVVLLLNGAATSLQAATDSGTAFLFGYLGGGPAPFDVTHRAYTVILAFKILPLVLVISALGALLFYWGVLQRLTGAFAWLLRRAMGVGGALALAAAVHIFVGMVEAPLLIRPYLARMQRGELFAVMTCGMAGVAGTVMVIYATVLGPVIPNALGTILVASIISTPAGLAVAALMVPFGPGEASGELGLRDQPVSSLDAIVRGTAAGVAPLVGITTMLLVAVSLVALVNMALGLLPGGITLQGLFAYVFRPVVWLIGVPWGQSAVAARLLGTKTVLNEFIAYLDLAALPADALNARSRLIMTFALCGFANFGSLGILIGGMGAMVPERRTEIVALGTRSLLSGTIATCLSGAVAGLLT